MTSWTKLMEQSATEHNLRMPRPDPYLIAFAEGSVARRADRPRAANPYAQLPASHVAHATASRLGNSWDAGWVFGKRG